FNTVTGEGAVLAAGTGELTSKRPVPPGEYLEIYATGLGAVGPSARLPGIQETLVTPRVLVAGVAAEGAYSGPAAFTPGLYQINAKVPAGVSGVVKLALEMEGRRGNEVNVTIAAADPQ